MKKVFLSVAVPLSVFSLSCEYAPWRESLWCRLLLPISWWWPVWWWGARIICFPFHASVLGSSCFLCFRIGVFSEILLFPVAVKLHLISSVRILCPSSSVRRSLMLLWDHRLWTASGSSLSGSFFIHLTSPYLNFTPGKAEFDTPPQWLRFFYFIFRKLGGGGGGRT